MESKGLNSWRRSLVTVRTVNLCHLSCAITIFLKRCSESFALKCDRAGKQRGKTTLSSKIWIFLPSPVLSRNFHPVSAGHVQDCGEIICTPVLICSESLRRCRKEGAKTVSETGTPKGKG